MFSRKNKFSCLEEALLLPKQCQVLKLEIDFNLKDRGPDFRKFTNLKELFIQGLSPIFYSYDFELPSEIGDLPQLRKLSLLNLPITDFSNWIFNLKKIRYLVLRGTDMAYIP